MIPIPSSIASISRCTRSVSDTLSRKEGAADCGEYRKAAGVTAQIG